MKPFKDQDFTAFFIAQYLDMKGERPQKPKPPEGFWTKGRAYEWICEHGVGHYALGHPSAHGCDGCCQREDFLGNKPLPKSVIRRLCVQMGYGLDHAAKIIEEVWKENL